jgi:hypothetical protein
MSALEHDDSSAFTAWRDDRARRKKQSQKGKASENTVKLWLQAEQLKRGMEFAWDRPVDTREAGGPVKAVVGDYDLMYAGRLLTMEVKETSFDRLPSKNFKRPQINRLKRRALAGVPVVVLVHHVGERDRWVVMPIEPFFEQVKGDFATDGYPTYTSAKAALDVTLKAWFNTTL